MAREASSITETTLGKTTKKRVLERKMEGKGGEERKGKTRGGR